MAQENSAKERQRKQLERKKQGRRARCPRLLIVCEGSKTEPNYFTEIRVGRRLPTANIAILPSYAGTDPLQVVEYAKHVFENGEPRRHLEPRTFDEIYVVFDRDDHRGYHAALDRAATLNNSLRNDEKARVPFTAVASVPSFELWLLLHFEEIHHAIHRDEVMRRLKGHIPGYEKGAATTFEATRGNLELATQRAIALAARFNPRTEPEPYTAIHTLVDRLIRLTEPPAS